MRQRIPHNVNATGFRNIKTVKAEKYLKIIMELKLKLEPASDEICMMCHFSSDCEKCCKKCKEPCNGKQICMQEKGEQSERLETWLWLIKNNEAYKDLNRFLLKKSA